MPRLQLTVNGRTVEVEQGTIVAAAIAQAGITTTRTSVRGEARAPLCGMGICYECRVTIDTVPHCLSCQTLCVQDMRVVTE